MDPEIPPAKIKKKDKLTDQFKLFSQQKLFRDPPTYLLSFVKEKAIQFDLEVFQADDMAFVPMLLALPINKIRVFRAESSKKSNMVGVQEFHQTPKFKNLLKEIAYAISSVPTLKSVVVQRVPIQIKHISALNHGDYLAKATKIKELSIKYCQLTDNHLQKIKEAVGKNQSLVIIDFSHNKLCEGGMVGKILSEHSARRDELMWMASLRSEQLEEDLSKKGICEINLQGNLFDDHSAQHMIEFLKDDQWTRCINLRDNRLTVEGIKSFARLMKKNHTIVSLDLRGNPGLTKQYSLYMVKKLKQNIERYKQQKKKYQNGSMRSQKNYSPHCQSFTHQRDRRKSTQNKVEMRATLEFTGVTANNTINFAKSGSMSTTTDNKNSCQKCRATTVEMLKLEKQNLDLQLEMKKLRHVLLTKNIDVSAILPNQQAGQQQNSVNESFNKLNILSGGESDQDLLMKVEQIMSELTKIMENIQGQQTTQINISNHLSNANSLSRTIPLFERAEEGMEQLEDIEDSQNDINDQTP